MKKVLSTSGFTLIELIVSSLLVAIITLGIFCINLVLSNNNQDYGQKYLVKSQTQTVLNHILNNVSLASGSGNANDEGILIGTNTYGSDATGVGMSNTFCIHQLGSTNGGANIIGSAADIWLCYQGYPSTDSTYPGQIFWCAAPYNTGANDPRGAESCYDSSYAARANLLTNTVTSSTVTYLGTSRNGFTNTMPTFVSSSSQTLFSITLIDCLNNTLSSCQASGISSAPTDNPEVSLSGSVIPLQTSS